VTRALPIVAVVAVVLLAGCYRGPGVNSVYGHGSEWPNGVLVDARDKAPDIEGLYPNGKVSFFSCCWMGKEAKFRTRLPPNARALRLDVRIPDLPPLRQHPETIRIRIAGVAEQTYPNLPVGERILVVPLPFPHPPVVAVSMQMSYTWRPIDWNITRDARELSVHLRRVRAK
jgi:hypothetical protein